MPDLHTQMSLTDAQYRAITTDGVDLVVVAGAGSGKTRVLVERYIRLLEHYDPAQVLAITFTDKAAREMRARVRDTLEQRARAARGAERAFWAQRRAEIEAARIGTIHSFCGALLRAHPAETGLDPRFEVLDEVQAALFLRASVDATLAAAVGGAGRPPEGAIEARGDARLVTAALEEFGPGELRELLVGLLQGGGAVRSAIAHLPTDAETLLERWRAALEAHRRATLTALLEDAGWQAACASLRSLALLAPSGDGLGDQVLAIAGLLDDLAAAHADCTAHQRLAQIDRIRLNVGAARAWGSPEHLRQARACLKMLRERYRHYAPLLAAPWDEPLERRAALAALGVAALYRLASGHYAAAKEAQDVLDFDDLEARALRLLQEHPAVRARWQRELAAILVDEFQDTNAAQRDLVYALAGYDERASPPAQASPLTCPPASSSLGRLFIVGDGKQSIYRFRGADVSVFGHVRAAVQAHGGREIALDVSFRAHARLVALTNHMFERIMRRTGPVLPYEVLFEALRQHRAPSPHPATLEIHVVPQPQRDQPFLTRPEDVRRYQARIVAQRLRELVESRTPLVAQEEAWRAATYGDIALLFQASASFDYYEEALRAEGIPFLTTAGRGYYGRKEVRDLIHLLRFLQDPGDDFSLVGVLRSPLFALDDATILRLRLASPTSLWQGMQNEVNQAIPPSARLHFAYCVLRDLLDLQGRVPVVELLRAALRETGYLATISGLRDGDRRRVNVEKLLEAARRAGGAGLATFSAYLEDMLALEAREGEAPLESHGAVRLMTVHRSKGLEFPIVVLPELDREAPAQQAIWLAHGDGGLALKLREGPAWVQPAAYRIALAEEARKERAERERLAYVALTRARDYLILAGQARETGGEDWFSWIVAALDWPWEQGGPPAGPHLVAGGALEALVWRHGPPEQPLAEAAAPMTGWDALASV
jgi:ATP-dependent helicase/nuclease subunit A